MEKEIDLIEPKLEDYGLDIFLYKEYKKKIADLHLIRESQEFSFWKFIFVISLPLSLIAFFIFKILWLSILIFLFSFILYETIKEFFDKSNEGLQNTIKEIESYIEKNSVKSFEEKASAYFSKQVDDFYRDRVYRKRWDGDRQEGTYREMLSEVSKIWQIFYGYRYRRAYYLLKKEEDRRFFDGEHKINRFNFSNLYGIKTKEKKEEISSVDNLNIKTEENPEQIKEISENSALDPNKRIKDEFRKNAELKRIEDELREKVELERIEKEKILRTPPEKRFRTARKIDNWEEINKKRKETGDKGEEIVFLLEKEYFESINRKDLAERVQHVSLKDDGLGYDILSFFDDEKEKFIEVKSTTASIESQFRFNISKNELKFLEEHKDDAFVYRVSLATEPPEIEIKPSSEILEGEITPTSFIIRVK